MIETSPNSRSPFVLSIRELERRAGTSRPVNRDIPTPADFSNGVMGVASGAPLSLDARLDSVVEGVILDGVVRTRLSGECARCLREIDTELEADICELYAYPDSVTDQTADADEISRVQDEMIDTEPAIRDAVLLAIPSIPLCREDCPGLCADCGERLDELPADHHHDEVDIRWAALQELLERPTAGASAEGDTPGLTQSNPNAEQEK